MKKALGPVLHVQLRIQEAHRADHEPEDVEKMVEHIRVCGEHLIAIADKFES